MFAGVKYYRTCAGHSDVSVISTTEIVSKTCPAFILFVTSKYVFMFHIVQKKSRSFPRITCSLSSCTEGNT